MRSAGLPAGGRRVRRGARRGTGLLAALGLSGGLAGTGRLPGLRGLRGLAGGTGRRLGRGARTGGRLTGAPLLVEVIGREDEGAQAHVTGPAEGEGDLLDVAVLDALAAGRQHRGGVVLAAQDQLPTRRDGQALALRGGELRGLAGARDGDRLQRLGGAALVEEGGGDHGRAGGLALGRGDDRGVLDLDVADGRRRVVRLDLQGLRVVAGRARGERGDGDCDGGGGEGAASKAAAHGGGNSLTRAWRR